MAFTQQRFLGASIRSFNGSIGWGGTPSRVTVNLVVDPANSDSFQTPNMGQPVIFAYDGWSFGGIVTFFGITGDQSGSPLYEVTLEDPRDVLSGCTLILNNYNGSTNGVPNLMNVYGYLEATLGFGGSQQGDAGIPWRLIRNAVVSLSAGVAPSYGGSIQNAGYSYRVDLNNLPSLPSYYRITSPAMTLMDFIAEVCSAASHDFYFMHTTVGSINTLKLFTVNRNTPPQFGAIANFIASTPGAVSKNVGYEFNSDITSKFLVGGNVEELYYQGRSGLGATASIWPFWGFDANGNVVIGEGINNSHTMFLDASYVSVWPGGTYWTDVAEMRAAEESEGSWHTFLWLNNFNRYRMVSDGSLTATLIHPNTGQPHMNNGMTVTYNHDGELNPHFGKATLIGCSNTLGENIADFLLNRNTSDLVSRFTKATDTIIRYNSQNQKENEQTVQVASVMYRHVQNFAQEYYGKKFMVRIPFISAAQDSTTGQVRLSREVTDGGYIEESAYITAASYNLAPSLISRFELADGRISAYVKFDNAQDLDLSEIPEDRISYNVLSVNGVPSEEGEDGETVLLRKEYRYSVFIRCDVDTNIGFVDTSTLFSPRAIITLPGAVRLRGPNGQAHNGVLAEFLRNKPNPPTEDVIATMFTGLGNDHHKLPYAGMAVLPWSAAIPLKSNISTYGPWYAAGANGKLDFEYDPSLVPWNYGGYTQMALAADAKVTSAINMYQVSEAGTIEFPGVPTINLGAQLALSGPYVTDINVGISENGATTQYNMKTWTPHPYRLRKTQTDLANRTSLALNRLRRELNSLKDSRLAAATQKAKDLKKYYDRSPVNSTKSSHDIIAGEISQESDGGYSANVVFQPAYLTASQLSDNQSNKYAASLDVLFYPFNAEEFTEPVSVIGANSVTLNPFSKQSKYGALLNDGSFAGPEVTGVFPSAQSLGMRLPMIGKGWGYNTNGDIITGQNTGTSFRNDINYRSDLWKVGPVDLRWDEDTGLWRSGGASQDIIVGKLSSNITAPSFGSSTTFTVDKYDIDGSSITDSGDNLTIYNFDPSLTVTNNTSILVVAVKLNGKYIPLWIGCES